MSDGLRHFWRDTSSNKSYLDGGHGMSAGRAHARSRLVVAPGPSGLLVEGDHLLRGDDVAAHRRVSGRLEPEFGRPKIALTVVDVEDAYQRVAAAGATLLCPITETRVSRFFFIADPDGTPIQLQEFSAGRQRVVELFA
ncbi:VOC family protein [Pseudofrankia sp. BMG5.37]|uniref:VOC family protein n=1 Tax=Pseudofrankia sp. BMG5.37 TaxID=3050035 RepID=UPI00289D5626|nr:VOC family protein [Pseudofrankia sp. BMG5.37]